MYILTLMLKQIFRNNSYMRNLYIFSLIISLLYLGGCSRNTGPIIIGKAQKVGSVNVIDTSIYGTDYSNYIRDSTWIYGTGNFDYRDTLETFHRGYSIPRDSVYKVYNIKEFEKYNFLIKKYPTVPGPYL